MHSAFHPLPCRALALCACLVLALPASRAADDGQEAPPVAETPAADIEAQTETPAADIEAQAEALLAAGRFAEALALLRPVVEAGAVSASMLFLYGLTALEASQHPDVADDARSGLLGEAVAAFHTLLVERPELVRVRLELARAFFLLGEDALATHHFESVLAGDPPAPVAANVRRFLAEMRTRGRWRFNLGFAVAPDSNIGATTDERTIYIEVFGTQLPFRYDTQATSGVGVSLWGGAEYQVPMSETLRLRAGADASRLEYAGSEFDRLSVAGHLGPRWLVGGDTEVSVLASARQQWTGTTPSHREFGARFEAGHRVSRSVTVSGRASWHRRHYRTSTHLDGPVLDTSLYGSWVVSPTVRTTLSLGYGRERPESERDRNINRWLGVDVDVLLPLGFTVGAGAEYHRTDYRPGWSPFVADGGARTDRTRVLRASVHHRAFTVFGFSPQLALVREERDSNAQLQSYGRTRGELRFVRQF